MPPSALNIFDLQEESSAPAEQLTKGFLKLLRLSPAAHQVWISLALPERRLYDLPRPWSFALRLYQPPRQPRRKAEAHREVETKGTTRDSGRAASDKTEGIISYGDKLTIVIRNSLAGKVLAVSEVTEPSLIDSNEPSTSEGRTVHWRDLIAAWSSLVDCEMASGAEQTVLIDFIDFVIMHFAALTPFTTLIDCGDHDSWIRRRLRAILNEIGNATGLASLELPGRLTVDQAHLEFNNRSREVRLVVYFASTFEQAKSLYKRTRLVSEMMSLRDNGWNVLSSLHVKSGDKLVAHATTDADFKDYLEYWRDRISDARWSEPWDTPWTEMVHQGLARAEENPQLGPAGPSASFTPQPRVRCFYSWTLAEARQLDRNGGFVNIVANQLNIALRALGERPLIYAAK